MFDRQNAIDVMKELENKERNFVSEADFQLSFALTIKEIFEGKFEVVPEFPNQNGFYYDRRGEKQDHKEEFDLLIYDTDDYKYTLIEFKYKTYNNSNEYYISTPFNKYNYILTNQGANDLLRYDAWSDISRIEHNIIEKNVDNGFFIILTNDSRYWTDNTSSKGNGLELLKTFSISQLNISFNNRPHLFINKINNQKFMYIKDGYNTSSCGVERYYKVIDIYGDYYFEYKDYAVVVNSNNKCKRSNNGYNFKYCVISIDGRNNSKNNKSGCYPLNVQINGIQDKSNPKKKDEKTHLI